MQSFVLDFEIEKLDMFLTCFNIKFLQV